MRSEEWLIATIWCLGVLGLAAGFHAARHPGRPARVRGAAALILGLAVGAVGILMAADVLSGHPIVYDNPRRALELRLETFLIALVTIGAGGWSLRSAWHLLRPRSR